MFLGNVTNYTNVVGTDIPFTTELNTNTKVRNSAGEISLLDRGLWDIDASIILTGVAGDITVQLFVDGVAKPTTIAVATLDAAADFATVPITDTVRTIFASYPDVANISLRVDTAGVIVSGKIRVEYVK